jgi:hypothetical protein
MGPRRPADSPAQALGRGFQQRRPVRLAIGERQLRVPGQALVTKGVLETTRLRSNA